VILVAVATAVVLGIAGGLYLLGGDGPLRLNRQHSVVTIGISVIPDATGTAVEVMAESADGSLPSKLDLELTRADDVSLTTGGSSTGGTLRYSDVRDGLGDLMPAEQVRSGRLAAVGTDGRRLALSYHVAAINGRRIVYPIPRTSQLTWVRARLYAPNGKVTCWGDTPSNRSVFVPCSGPQVGEIDGGRHSAIRLELT
jgi:hypothetical protein